MKRRRLLILCTCFALCNRALAETAIEFKRDLAYAGERDDTMSAQLAVSF